MDKNQLLRAALESGVDPVETKLVALNSTATRQTTAYRTVLQLNTQQLGVLYPAEYEPVASRTVQSVNLALSNITDVADIIETAAERGIKVDWFSVACPVRMISKGSISRLLGELFEDVSFPAPSKLCLEFPSQILFEDSETVSRELGALKFLGVKTAVSGFGDAYCPVMRIGSFPFNYVILDRSVTALMENNETSNSAMSLTALIRGYGIEVVAEGAVGNEIISRFYQSDCGGYIPEPDRLLSIDEALPDRKGY